MVIHGHHTIPKVEFEKTSRPRRTLPWTVLVDQREKAPWTFSGISNDKRERLYIPRELAHLQTGDYSIKGYETLVTVERKSLEDLAGSCGNHRERFEREHARMQALGPGNACVIVEASWAELLEEDYTSRISRKTLNRTRLSWFARYGVPWFFPGSRRHAELMAFRYLWMWLKNHREER